MIRCPRVRRAIVICLLVIAAALTACSRPGRPIEHWTMTLEGEARGTEIDVPGSQLARLPPFRDSFYHLSASVKLDQHETRQTWIMLDCFHGELRLTVDGSDVRDFGDTSVGEHVWALPPSLTARGQIELVLYVHHDWNPYSQLLTAPRIASGPPMAGATASFDRLTSMAAVVVCLFVAVAFGLGWLFDRRRIELAAFAVAAAANAVTALGYAGVLPGGAGWLGPILMVAAHGFAGLGLAYFVHTAFGLGPPPRWLANASLALVVVACAGAGSDAILVIDVLLVCAYWLVAGAYLLYRYARLSGLDARLLLAAHAVAILAAWLEMIELAVGRSFVDGAHVVGVGQLALFAVGVVVVQRRTAARQRAAEAEAAARTAELDAVRAKDPAVTALEPGAVVDAYTLGSALADGGFELDGNRRFQTVRGRFDATALAAFAKDAELARALDHPGVARVVDVGASRVGVYVVSERAEPVEDVRARLRALAGGLVALHDAGLVHGAISIAAVDGARLRLLVAAPATTRSKAGDIRDFGALAYELLAGKPADPDDLDLTPIDAPKLRDLVERCLQDDEAARPTASEVAALLA